MFISRMEVSAKVQNLLCVYTLTMKCRNLHVHYQEIFKKMSFKDVFIAANTVMPAVSHMNGSQKEESKNGASLESYSRSQKCTD